MARHFAGTEPNPADELFSLEAQFRADRADRRHKIDCGIGAPPPLPSRPPLRPPSGGPDARAGRRPGGRPPAPAAGEYRGPGCAPHIPRAVLAARRRVTDQPAWFHE